MLLPALAKIYTCIASRSKIKPKEGELLGHVIDAMQWRAYQV